MQSISFGRVAAGWEHRVAPKTIERRFHREVSFEFPLAEGFVVRLEGEKKHCRRPGCRPIDRLHSNSFKAIPSAALF